jgi:tetratricopeptide (TPR) repeat protein
MTNHSWRHFSALLLFLAGALALASAGSARAAAADDAAAKAPEAAPAAAAPEKASSEQSSDPLDDPAEPFVPLHKRSGRDEDRVRALALFAAGRVAEQKQDYPLALKRYQRAFRSDPTSTAPLREIVPLAFNLDRQAEAVRYALMLAEREPSDPALLRRLAIYLTEEGNTERALGLYEKALALQAAEKQAPSLLVSRMEMGRLYFVAKKFDKAADEFAIVLKALENPKESGLDESMQKALLGKPEVTWQVMGESFLADGKPELAMAAFEKAQAAKDDPGLYAYNKARVELKRKRPAQAIARLAPYFDKHLSSQGTAPYQTLADALAEIGHTDQLIPRLEKLRETDPDNVPLAYFLAQRLTEAGQLDQAKAVYADMIDRHKSRPAIEAYVGLVDIERKQKNADALLATLSDVVGRVGTLAPLGEAGKALLDDQEMAQAVLKAAERQLEADPDKLGYGGRLVAAHLALEAKDYATASKFFDLAIAADKEKAPQTLVTWGLELFMADQFAEAARVFQRGIDAKLSGENEAALYFYLAGALAMSDKTDDGIAAAQKAAELKPDAPRFSARAAWILYHAKRYDEARKRYQELLDKYDKQHDSPEAREALRDARLVLSNISVLENKQPESEEWLEQVLDEFPEDIGALNDLGYLWADSDKHLELALEMIEKAVASDPKNMAYRDSLGWVLYRLGRAEEAVAELQAAASVNEPDGVILDHLGDALAKSGNVPQAIDAWNRAAAAFEKNNDADKAKAARDKVSQAQAAAEANKEASTN